MILSIHLIFEIMLFEVILKYSEHKIAEETLNNRQNAKLLSSIIYKIITLILE